MIAKIKRKRKAKKSKLLKTALFYLFFAVASLGLVFFLIVTNLKIYQRRSILNARIAELKKEVEILEDRNKNLKENIDYVESEDYLERVAREQLNMKKPGEEVVVIQKEEGKEEKNQEDKNWWEKLKGIFMRD